MADSFVVKQASDSIHAIAIPKRDLTGELPQCQSTKDDMKKNPLGVGTGMLPNLYTWHTQMFALGSIDRKPWPWNFSNAFWKKMPATLSMIWLERRQKTSNWLVLNRLRIGREFGQATGIELAIRRTGPAEKRLGASRRAGTRREASDHSPLPKLPQRSRVAFPSTRDFLSPS